MADLKQSTAATLTIGPVFDLANGLVYTGMAIGDFSISKNGTMAAMAAAATATSAGNGMYSIGLTTGNTDTVGRLVISCNKAGYQMAPWVFRVLSATMFDAIVTNGVTLPTDVQTIKGQAVTCAAPVTVNAQVGTAQVIEQADSGLGAYYVVASDSGGNPLLTSNMFADYVPEPIPFVQIGGVQYPVIALPTDAITADSLSAAAVTKIQSGLVPGTPVNVTIDGTEVITT